jgi:hypothetical protein
MNKQNITTPLMRLRHCLWWSKASGMEGKCTCKNVSTSTLKSVFEIGNKKCEIGGATMSYLKIDV